MAQRFDASKMTSLCLVGQPQRSLSAEKSFRRARQDCAGPTEQEKYNGDFALFVVVAI